MIKLFSWRFFNAKHLKPFRIIRHASTLEHHPYSSLSIVSDLFRNHIQNFLGQVILVAIHHEFEHWVHLCANYMFNDFVQELNVPFIKFLLLILQVFILVISQNMFLKAFTVAFYLRDRWWVVWIVITILLNMIIVANSLLGNSLWYFLVFEFGK